MAHEHRWQGGSSSARSIGTVHESFCVHDCLARRFIFEWMEQVDGEWREFNKTVVVRDPRPLRLRAK